MNSLEFIKKHVKEWPDDRFALAYLSYDGVVFCDMSSRQIGSCKINIPSNYCADGIYWTREEFEACDTSGRVSTVNRDIERVTGK